MLFGWCLPNTNEWAEFPSVRRYRNRKFTDEKILFWGPFFFHLPNDVEMSKRRRTHIDARGFSLRMRKHGMDRVWCLQLRKSAIAFRSGDFGLRSG